MKPIKRVYIAGILSSGTGYYSKNTAINYLVACRELAKWGLKVWQAGFVPFVPSFDSPFWFVLEEGQYITEAMIKKYSRDWLEVCDAILLTPGWIQSPGSIVEKELADKLGIPTFDSLDTLIEVARREE